MPGSKAPTHILDLTERRRLEDRLRELLLRLGEDGGEAERLLDALLELHEHERRRVIQDIHDDPLQLMTTTVRRLGLLRQEAPSNLREQLMELEELTRQAVARLRRVMGGPTSPALERMRLLPTLRARLHELRSRLGVGCVLQNRLRSEPPTEVRVALVRIAVEALTNVRRHAKARRVEVCLEDRGDGILLRVRDDGRGFDPDEIPRRPGHFGLRVMRERAELAGGWLSVTSARGRGTTVDCWIPVRSPTE
jgi:signal transduction histidine kinase